jgi:hypothetical protein
MKLLEMFAHALRWMFETVFLAEVIVVVLFLIVFFIIGTSVTTNKDNPNSTENKFKVACTAVNGAPVWNGKNWECIK